MTTPCYGDSIMRKRVSTTLALLAALLFSGVNAQALDTTLHYDIRNNANQKITVKLQKYSGDNKVDTDLAAGGSKSGSWKYDVKSTIHTVLVKVHLSGNNNDLGCSVHPGSAYVGFDQTFDILYGNDKVLSVKKCEGPNGCRTITCTAVRLNP